MARENTEREHNSVFLSLELHLAEEAIPSILDRLLPPTGALPEAAVSVQEHWNPRMHEVAALLAEVRRLLSENRLRLSGQSAPRFEHVSTLDPDEQYVPDSIEAAQELEMQSRMAQSALQAQAKEFQREYDTAFQVAKSRLKEAMQLTLDERACLTARASTVGAMCDQEQWPPEVFTLLREISKLLAEIELHRRLLCEESTAILKWANVPNVYISPTLDEARLLKKISKRDRDNPLARENASLQEEAAAQ